MASKIEHRNVTPILQMIRNYLLGRNHTPALRFQDEQAARTQPQPVLPEGPAHQLSANYYCNRDGRREISPETILVDGRISKAIAAGASPPAEEKKVAKQPGTVYNWD